MLRILEANKTWTGPAAYTAALEALPLGPNVAAFIGHSDIRTHVLGLGRGTDKKVKPTRSELGRMGSMLEDAIDAGMLGLSSMTQCPRQDRRRRIPFSLFAVDVRAVEGVPIPQPYSS